VETPVLGCQGLADAGLCAECGCAALGLRSRIRTGLTALSCGAFSCGGQVRQGRAVAKAPSHKILGVPVPSLRIVVTSMSLPAGKLI
jgi:hypothetical protein